MYKSRIYYPILFLLLFIVFFSKQTAAQENWWKPKKYKTESEKQKFELCYRTFKDISLGFSVSSAGIISKYITSDTYLDIIGNEKGLYNPAQAEYIIADFMDYFRVLSFKYVRSNHRNSYAFAMGKYTYNIGSGNRTLNLSISLKYRDNIWIVDQIVIN